MARFALLAVVSACLAHTPANASPLLLALGWLITVWWTDGNVGFGSRSFRLRGLHAMPAFGTRNFSISLIFIKSYKSLSYV